MSGTAGASPGRTWRRVATIRPQNRPPRPRCAADRGEITYRGRRDLDADGNTVVTVTDARGTRSLLPRLDLRNHSPTGFEWQYAGSGPPQLALAILADLLGDDRDAQMRYQRFKFAVVARLPYAEWELTAEEIRRVLQGLDATRV